MIRIKVIAMSETLRNVFYLFCIDLWSVLNDKYENYGEKSKNWLSLPDEESIYGFDDGIFTRLVIKISSRLNILRCPHFL